LGIQPFVKAYLSKSSGRDEAPQTPVQVNTFVLAASHIPDSGWWFPFCLVLRKLRNKVPGNRS